MEAIWKQVAEDQAETLEILAQAFEERAATLTRKWSWPEINLLHAGERQGLEIAAAWARQAAELIVREAELVARESEDLA